MLFFFRIVGFQKAFDLFYFEPGKGYFILDSTDKRFGDLFIKERSIFTAVFIVLIGIPYLLVAVDIPVKIVFVEDKKFVQVGYDQVFDIKVSLSIRS